jgi:serine phosphatase RsbU (regulator of sigma subunit)/anti-sigma regulatory factor (Ser/Thr protein kinase)
VNVLMVDDDAVMRHLVKTWLKGRAHCLAVSTPNLALEALHNTHWDIFFVDLNLGSHHPDGGGLSLVEVAHRLHPQVACVLMTAHGKQEEFSSAVNLGVDQILIKPFLKQNFFATLKRLQDIQQTREALKAARILLEQQNEELQTRRLHEQKLATLAQKYLLFPLPQENFPGLKIQAASQAQDGASGDLVDVVATQRGVCLVSGDVMGKGLGAAIVSAGIKISLSQLRPLQYMANPRQVLRQLREKVTPMLKESESLLTLSLADIDTQQGMLEWVDCGAPHLLLQRACDGHILFISGHMMPLGIASETITSCLVPLLQEDRLLLVSDGILDAWGLPLAQEAYQKIAHIMALHPRGQEAPLVNALVKQLCASTGVADDRTCIALHYTAPNPPSRVVHSKQFQAQIQVLPDIRAWVENIVSPCLTQAEETSRVHWKQHMTLGLSETASNVIGHACLAAQANAEPIQLLVILDRNGLWLEWHYQGKAFKPPERESRTPPEPDLLAQSGYGLSIIDAVFEHVHYFTSIPHGQSIVTYKPWPLEKSNPIHPTGVST